MLWENNVRFFYNQRSLIMKKLKSQSGRSMVEMLGVLAIIGVLSVGGIAGYSLSMRRHRANQILDYVSKYAIDAYSQCYKDVIDGNNSYITDLEDCPQYLPSYYADSDETPNIGPLPTGIKELGLSALITNNDGEEIISVFTDFTDAKLCQAVASITGTGTCSDNHIEIKIKQN